MGSQRDLLLEEMLQLREELQLRVKALLAAV